MSNAINKKLNLGVCVWGVLLVVFGMCQGQGFENACFDGGCNLRRSSADWEGTELAAVQTIDLPTGTAPAIIALVSGQRSCLLSSGICKGVSELNMHLPCCCEVKIGLGATADYIIQLPGKFTDDLEGLLQWNSISEIKEGQVLQLCLSDASLTPTGVIYGPDVVVASATATAFASTNP
eukprot:TRINITY_DN320_c0_g2_i3.p3 TRINITY_DN320_c0_g2~~TRINITY_DN320_c0_g2_i3.p3  ORF type:complete len:179 (-),score=17.91 TRINITY_DN320_c0_g2_i3:843-1379(-)